MTAPHAGESRIIDRGYRRFEGERRGVGGSIRSLSVHSVQRALGLRRTLWAKVLPILAVAIAYVPAIVFVGLVALLPKSQLRDMNLPTYGEYYGFVVAALVVFVGLVAPEVMCTDRRTGMLGVYLASPLSRDTYLLGKVIAIASVLALVTIGPPLLMLVAFVLQGAGPASFGDVLLTLGRIVLGGACISAFYTAISVGVSSLTDRKAVASATVIMLIVMSGGLVASLIASGAASGELAALNIFHLPLNLARAVHGEPLLDQGLSAVTVWSSWIGWTLLGGLVARWRYQHLVVTR
ncbi:MAG: hypothetical protein JWM05_1176 [Acidimicrobiales bacterium]|nr:hypothetical protein [Acidimicrobiales bacterium]